MDVVQGTDRGYDFSINQRLYNNETETYETTPFNLTDWTINFYVKPAPYYSVEPMITKIITTTSDQATVGQITDPENGQFTVQVVKEETLYPPYDYYLIIELTNGSQIISITRDGNHKSVFRILTQ